MAYRPLTDIPISLLTSNSTMASGYVLEAYVSNTSTPATLYSDASGTTAGTSITLDARGEPTTIKRVWLDTAVDYKLVLKTAAGVEVWTADPVYGGSPSELSIFTQTGTGSIATTVQDKLRETVSVMDFGAVGDGVADDSAAFANAFTTGKKVYAPAGTYALYLLNIPSNSYLYGDGESTVIKPYNVTGLAALGANSGSTSSYITGVTIRDVKFLGSVATNGFWEQAHLVVLEGVKRARIENCYFEGFRGDGLYIGAGRSGTERHNVDVVVKNCVFDGVNNDNRNGISVIDIDGIEIEGCTFRNCARSTMPGSIDFEPDNGVSCIRNVRVIGNRFYNTDGNRGHLVFSTQHTLLFENVVIKGNHFEDAGTQSAILFNTNVSTPTNPTRVIIEGNTATITGGNFVYKRDGDTDGFIIANNIASCLRGVWFSTASTAMDDSNITIVSNTFYVENNGYGVLLSENVSNIAIRNNIINGTANRHILIGGNGTSQYVSICDNDFIGTPVNTTIGHTSTVTNPSTNVCTGNRFTASHQFRAIKTDFAGSIINPSGGDESTLPSGFPYGICTARINGRTIAGASQTGMLYTYKQTSASNAAIWQEFIPDYDATYKDDRYFRKAVDASTWDSWYRVTGV